MSESGKMGLFGSKDEHNASTSEESKSLEKSKENSPDHYAPYNIDSDSETYDTEALSMMDINDIIGVQADNTGDSTLESEFAALSEIITDSKDEFSLRDVGSAAGKETANKSDRDGAQRKKITEVSTTKDNTDRSGDKIKLGGMTSISKSLQLIGEAYISEDSQETDNEDVQESSTRKIENDDKSLLVSKDSEDPKLKEKLLTEQTENSSAESSTMHIKIEQAKEDPRETEKMEVSEKLEALESTAIATFEDSIHSPIVSDAKEMETSDDLEKISQASGNKEISESAELLDSAVSSNLKEVESSEELEKSLTSLKSTEATNSAITSDFKEFESSENLEKSTEALKVPESAKFSDSIDSTIISDLHEAESSGKPSEISSEDLEDMEMTESADLTDSIGLSDPIKAESTEILEKSPGDSKSMEIIESAESMDCAESSNLKEESTEILEKPPNDSKSIKIIESAESMDCPVSSNLKKESTEILQKSPNDSKSIEIIESAESMDCPVSSNLEEESTEILEKPPNDSKSIKIIESAESMNCPVSSNLKEKSTEILQKSPNDSKSIEIIESAETMDCPVSSNLKEESTEILEKPPNDSKSIEIIESAESMDCPVSSNFKEESTEILQKPPNDSKSIEIIESAESMNCPVSSNFKEESTEILQKPPNDSKSIEIIESAESMNCPVSSNLKEKSTEILQKSPNDSKSIEIIESAETMDSPVSSNFKEESTEILQKPPNDSKSIEIIESAESMNCPVSSNFKEESTEILQKPPNDSKSIEIIESAESMDSPVSSNLKEKSTEISKKSSEDSESIEFDESAHSTDPAISKDSKGAESTKISEKSSKDSESTKLEKSTDSTDSAIPSEQLNDNIESMDVDLPSPTNNEKFSTENQTVEISKQSDVENIIDDSDKKLPVIEAENSTFVSEEVEEPMEVDEPNENLPEIVKEEETPVTEKEAIKNHPETSKSSTTEESSLVNEGIDIPPEETRKLLPDDSEKIVETSSCEEKTVDKVFSSNLLSKQILETVEEESEPESVKSPENEITDKKIEMEMEELEQSIVEDIPSKILDEVIDESISKLDEQEPQISLENVESQSEKSSKEIEEIVEEKEDEEETIEPMEIDNPEETETKDDSNTTDLKVSENTVEFGSSEITGKTSESAENSSEILEKLEGSSIDVSTASASCNESAENIATRQEDSLPVTSKESFENVPIASESCKKSSDVIEITKNSFPVKLDKNAEDVPEVMTPCETSSGINEKVQVEPHYSSDEDEKMEVDGSLKREIEESIVPRKIIEEKMEEQSEILSIDTVDDSSIASQEVNSTTDDVNVELSHLSEISSDKASKIVPSKIFNEVVSEKPEEKEIIAPKDEKDEILDEEILKSKDEAEAEEKSSILVEISQSEENVPEDTLDIEIKETVSETNERKEECKKENKSSISVEISQSEKNVPEDTLDMEIKETVSKSNEHKEEFKKENKSSISVEISKSEENVPEATLDIEIKETVSEKNEYKEEFNKEDKSSIPLESSESLKSLEIEDANSNEETSQDSMEIEENKRDTESKKDEQEFSTFSEKAESSMEKNLEDAELSEKPVDIESERNETESSKDEENETAILDEKDISKEDDDENSNLTQNVSSNEENVVANEESEETVGEKMVLNEENEETMSEEIVSNEEKEETPSEIIIENQDEEETLITIDDAVSSEKTEETSSAAETTLPMEEEEETSISAEKEDEQEVSTEPLVEENSVLSKNIDSTSNKNKTSRLISAIRKIRSSNDKNDSWLRRNVETTIFNRTESKTESSFDRDDIFSKPKIPLDESNPKEKSMNPIDDANNEDPIDDEMNLSLDPEIIENPERMMLDADEEMEDNVEMNLSLDPDDKDEETTSRQIEDCSDEKTDDNYEETTDKSMEDSYANSKDIMSSRSDCETELYRDDEQSQSTQEMMESILETDKGNINKILDDEEADCDALERRQNLESSEIDDIAEKLPNESDELLSKALDDPMTSQNIDSLEGLLDLDLMPENDEPALKSVEPIVEKVMEDNDDDVETIDKDDDVSLLIEDNEPNANDVNDDNSQSVDDLIKKSNIGGSSDLIDNELEAFNLNDVDANPMENSTEDTKMDLAEDLLRDIAVEDERKMELAKELMLESGIEETDLLLSSSIPENPKINIPDEVFLDVPVESVEREMELTENLTLEIAVPDQVLEEVAGEIEDLPPTSEISELESAVKFLQESEEHDIESPLVLSPKMVEGVVDDITTNPDVVMFPDDSDICDDPAVLDAELESIIPDPIAISEAEIINEAAKLESERKTKITEEAKSQSPNVAKIEFVNDSLDKTPPIRETTEISSIPTQIETPKTHREVREIISKSPIHENIEHEPLKKSAPIPKISILEERLKIPPKIEIPQGEMSRIIDNTPTTPRTSLLIQRDSKSFQKMLESPKSMESKGELKIVDTPRKDTEKYDFENVGSPRIILKIAKAAFADCGEPRSPKSPKIRSATNSPNPEDSPGQKLGKIKLKLSKGGHPSIIPNDNVEELCGQWHTEGSSSLSPLGMKIKFSKIADSTFVPHGEKHDEETTKEPSKHKFEEAKRTDSPIGMKIKLSRTGEPSIIQQESKDSCAKHKEKLDIQDSPKRTESPIGMKIKLSKYGDASIIQPEKQEVVDEHRDSRIKEKVDTSQQHTDRNDTPCRTESPLGMKFKLFKTGDASIVQSEATEDSQQEIKRTDSPLGMKIKLSKNRGGASIVSSEIIDDTKLEIPEVPRRTESPLGMKIKLSKTGDASIIHTEEQRDTAKHKTELATQETSHISEKRHDTSIGMKIKLSKSGDASIVHPDREDNIEDNVKEKMENLTDNPRKTDATIGMKIKFSKTGDATILPPKIAKKSDEMSSTKEIMEIDNSRSNEAIAAMKIKLQKSGEGSIVEIEKKEKSTRRKDTEMPLEMKIKLSKTGHPTIITCENYADTSQRGKDCTLENASSASTSKHKESSITKEITGMKSILKSMQQNANLHAGRSELTIEPIHLQQSRKSEISEESSQPKRKDITISPIEAKKTKLEAQLSQIFPEVTIQPVVPREQKKMMFDAKSSISRQQMNVISQEISITHVRPSKPIDLTITEKLKSMLKDNTSPSRDCEIIEHHPELIIVNENSNSSQDVMIIEEVPALRGPDVKTPKKRGRPRRNPLPLILAKPMPQTSHNTIQRDPLALDDVQHMVTHLVPQAFTTVDSEASGRPKRTCRSQKSYAPPRRGRGRGGRGKRKMDMDMEISKRPRMDQDLEMIEHSTTALITIHEPPEVIPHGTSELYKALRQPTMDRQMPNAIARVEAEQAVNDTRNNPDIMEKDRLESLMDARIMSHLDGVIETSISNKSTKDETFEKERKLRLVDTTIADTTIVDTTITVSESIDNEIIVVTEKSDLLTIDDKIIEKIADDVKNKDSSGTTNDQENWLTPSSKKQLDGRNEGNISNVQVMDEETRMSAESVSRSQTPAKNISVQAPETIVNEESQGSVLSTATTESEKVKAKTRRMEITLDPDEGPFTVDRIAEYDWPLDPMGKGELFMIQEQISQYLGVKSFKRKYPDLKRRMVDMEERNYLRENALVSEAMCDMGLTAVSSSEVLDVMCSDFPDQYEEYRKYIREKQMKEHLKKQKELTAAANAERNRIDLAEMAVQSALSWNVGLNKARRESRKCSLDLQTFTIHVPKKQQKIEEEDRGNHYPVALIPGQYTDYYREYTPAELRYYPLNTVLYGPMKPNERKFDSQSEGSQSDSDSDSSSDDSSSSSSEGTQDTEASQSTMDDVDVELSRQKEDIKSIKCKMCLKHLNKFTRIEVLIQCGTCNGYVHPSCIDLTLDMVPHIQAYAWQCTDCKTCAQCHDPADEDKMLFCDMCDRGYHIYCVGLRRVPQGRWHCQECAVCASCGSREAGGANSDRNSVAQWQHEYKKGDKNTRVYVSTLCVPCSKLWRKGRYCPNCSRCHTVPRPDLEANLVHCNACDKYLHLDCVETKDLTIDRKNYLCDFCQPLKHPMVKPLVSKVFRT